MKRNLGFFMIIVFTILTISLCVVAEENKILEITNVQDTSILKARPFDNIVKADVLRIGSMAKDETSMGRGLIKFDLSQVPKGIEIVSAKLAISGSVQPRAENPILTLKLYRLLVDWDPNTVNWLMRKSTDDEMLEWNTPGVMGEGKDIDTATVIEFTSGFGWGYKEIDVTEHVKGFLSGKYPNYGWMFKLDEEKANNQYYYLYSSKASESQPKLIIEYK